MNDIAVVVCLLALALIGLLPRIFFRRGTLNARWLLTAAPFAVTGATLLVSLPGWVRSPVSFEVRAMLAWPALILAGSGIALIRWTLDTHAQPVSLWHQEDDRPGELVTRGAYAHVRHPFYASFLLVLAACALALPHALTALALVAALVLLDRTAAREERRLLDTFGEQYARYLRRTGRFLPRRSLTAPAVALLLTTGALPASAQRMPEIDVDEIDAEEIVRASRGLDYDRDLNSALGGGLGIGAGVGVMLATRSDAPGDVLLHAALGGAIAAGVAHVTSLRGDEPAAVLLGALAGSLAGALLGHATGGEEIDAGVVLISSVGLAALLGRAASTLAGDL